MQVQVQNIVKRYANHTALDHVSFEVPDRSIFGLLGPNGAGKTTLIRILTRIIGPDSGAIYFNNEASQPRHIYQIGYLPEERGLYKKMEVGEQALYFAQLKGMSRQQAIKELRYWFEKFEILPWWKKKVEELSKGMAQKLQFIVTVVHRPHLLILDEPFTGFDPVNTNLIKEELLRLNKEGTTIMLSTHRMESVEELCTHIVLINKAKNILSGTVKDIRRQYRTGVFEVRYKGHPINLVNGMWGPYELMEHRQEDDHYYACIRLQEPDHSNELLQALIREVHIMAFHEQQPSMNDIFIQAVQEQNVAAA
jgi:ABC-2 type transport system ATP-binding protein